MTTDETPDAQRPHPTTDPTAATSAAEFTWSPVLGSAHDQASQPAPDAYAPHQTYGYGGWAPPLGPTTTVLTPPATASTEVRRRGRWGLVLVASAMAAVIGAGAGAGSYALVAHENPTSSIAVSTAPAAQTAVLDGTVSAAAAKITPSVVTITVQGQRSSGIGTGIVLDTEGHIVTNNHVVAAGGTGSRITVAFSDGRTATATVVGTDVDSDLAVIKVDGVSGLTPATFAASSSVEVGQAVVAVGAPLGLSDTVTSGVVSATNRPVRSGEDNDAVYLAVQTDTAINPGNSGGPLVDLNGQVIGINSSIASTASSSEQAGNIGIGFAIPADLVTRVATELINTGTVSQASLGVSVSGNDSMTTATTATGVTLAQVTAGGAAAKAGLQSGDVVTRIDGVETTTPDTLIAAVRFHAPGAQVVITYLRDGESHTATVTLGQG